MDEFGHDSDTGCGTLEKNAGQLLVEMDKIKAELLRELKSNREANHQDSEALRAEMRNFYTSVTAELKKLMPGGTRSTRLSRSQGSRSRGTEGKRSEIPEEDDIPYLSMLAAKDRCELPMLRCTIILTVLSFINAFPNTKSWASERVKENMAGGLALLPGVSGFSLVFFSVAPDDPKTRFKEPMGQLWSFLCIKTIVIMLLSARATVFDYEDPATGRTEQTGNTMPGWLRSFGGMRRATEIVSSVVTSLEQTGGVPLARNGKRPRLEGAEYATDADKERGAREQAVRVMRSGVLRVMTDGRHEARMHLFRKFVFLIEKMLSFESIASAREEGYDIVVHEPASESEMTVPDNITGTIWDIEKTVTGEKDPEESKKKHAECFSKLSAQFPCLKATLRYKRFVRRGPSDTHDGFPEFFSENLYWSVIEDISLHRVAMGVLMSVVKAGNYHEVMEASGPALRAVHIVAFALRGLIRTSLNQTVTEVEKAALGDVTYRVLEKGENSATVMVGNRFEKFKEGRDKSGIEKEREALLEIPWAKYKVLKKQRNAEARNQEESTRSAVLQTESAPAEGDDNDYDVSWIS